MTEMLGSVRLYDYRCFQREQPAVLQFRTGFTSFIGPNNAGKSSLIKSIYEIRNAIQALKAAISSGSLVQSSQVMHGWSVSPPLHEHTEIVNERENPACAVELDPCVPSDVPAHLIVKARMEFATEGGMFKVKLLDADGAEIGVPNTSTVINSYSHSQLNLADRRTLDLRPLIELLDRILEAQYLGPFRNAINEGGGGHFDSQIGTGFISQWHYWKTGPTKLLNRAVERVTEDIRRLLNAKTLQINASIELKTLQVVVDGRPHKLQELGAGFSQLVLALGNALMRKPSFVLIDEPELHLHPALQGEFLTTLAMYARHGIIYTTHSMGLARLADACYTVQRTGERSIVRPFDRTPQYAEFLGSLGISGLLDLGWNCVLLVEGTKDVRTMQQFLRLYGKDRRTIVLPLGGDSMINGAIAHELAEVRRLCNRVFAVVDSERASVGSAALKAREKFAEVCAGLEINCCVTERRAIENYISQSALDQAFAGSGFKALASYDAPAKDGSFWGKGESWRAAAMMTLEELGSTDVGRLLAQL